MFKNLLFGIFIFSIALFAACKQADPTIIDSTYQKRDNKSVVNHNANSEANHSETVNSNGAHSESNAAGMNGNTVDTQMKPAGEATPTTNANAANANH